MTIQFGLSLPQWNVVFMVPQIQGYPSMTHKELFSYFL